MLSVNTHVDLRSSIVSVRLTIEVASLEILARILLKDRAGRQCDHCSTGKPKMSKHE